MRKLNERFVDDLKGGCLSSIIKRVQSDDTLIIGIRDNKINVYYRGGSLLKIEQKSDIYTYKFDLKYCKDNPVDSANIPIGSNNAEKWVESFPFIKNAMDTWFSKHRKYEREFQQVLFRDNNIGPCANGTDYFISDIEYSNSENRSRFDMVGFKWPSNRAIRKNGKKTSLAIFEVKYGDGALKGTSGIKKHFADIQSFISDEKKLESLYVDAESIFNQQLSLGLIPKMNELRVIKLDRNIKPEFIFVLVNHDSESTKMRCEIREAVKEYSNIFNKANVKFARANYMGYGLYGDCLMTVEDLLNEH